MPFADKQKKYSKEELLDVVEKELKDAPYRERLKEELQDHLEDREKFGQISGQKNNNDVLGDPRVITLLCRSFLSRKKSRLAFLLLAVLFCLGLFTFIIYTLYPGAISFQVSVLIGSIEAILVISIACLLPSFRAKDLW
jgi:hypothetical protein